MAKKKNEEVVKKATKKVETIKKDSLKEELTNYIDDKIKSVIALELEKSYKKTIRDKNIKIIIKNMIIIILLLVIIYMVYILNDNDYFDKFFIEETNDEKTSEVASKSVGRAEEESEEETEPTFEELKKQYAYLLDNIYVNENSKYVEDYYNGKLTNELKNYLTMNFVDISSLTKEDNYNVIENDKFKQCYEKKFIGEYTNKAFTYNGNTFRYISKLDSYITDELVTENSTNIVREINDITIKDDKIMITTIEGLVKEGKLYNIISNEEVSEYSTDKLVENSDKLNKVRYIFDEDDKLLKIEK